MPEYAVPKLSDETISRLCNGAYEGFSLNSHTKNCDEWHKVETAQLGMLSSLVQLAAYDPTIRKMRLDRLSAAYHETGLAKGPKTAKIMAEKFVTDANAAIQLLKGPQDSISLFS